MQYITDLDFQILYWIQEHLRNGVFDAVMPYITHLGSAGIIWIVTAFIMITSRKYRNTGIMILIGMFLGLIVTNFLLKNVVARERPCWIDTEISMLIAIPKDFSFPSGHTTSSVIASMMIFHGDKKSGVIAWIVAVLIIFSRMYLFVHFPTDILCGAVIGVVIGMITPGLTEKIMQRIQKSPA